MIKNTKIYGSQIVLIGYNNCWEENIYGCLVGW